jgi:hypothetical protein
VGLQMAVQILAVTEQLPAHGALMGLLLLPAAPQMPDKVDPPTEDFPTVRTHVGLLGGLCLAPHLSAAPTGGREATRVLWGAPSLLCAEWAVLGVLIPRAG